MTSAHAHHFPLLGTPADRITTATARRRTRVDSPLTGRPMPAWPICEAEDVELALTRAGRAQQSWAATPVEERAAIVRRLSTVVWRHEKQLLDLIQAENGKARAHAFEELTDVALTAKFYAQLAPRALAPRRVTGPIPLLTRADVHHHPLGVVAVISPWNYPLTLAVSDAVAALAAGNAVIIKPDERTVLNAVAAKVLLEEAGLPDDLFQILAGDPATIGEPLIAGADFLMFTGSTPTGRMLAARAGEQLIGFSAELGGKNPLIVLNDAPMRQAVRGAVKAGTSNSGQLCISTERIYVEDSAWDRFVPAFVRAMGSVRVAADTNWRTGMGPLISAEQLAAVEEAVEDARGKGAQVLTGGTRLPDVSPTAYAPTVLTDVTPEMSVHSEETFGPVVSVYRVADVDEALSRANDSDYGLNASLWTRPSRGRRLARQVETGTVNVNDSFLVTWSSYGAPMGGRRASGLGRRHGVEGLVKYTDPQTVGTARGVPLQAPPLLGERGWAAVMRATAKLKR